MAKQLVGIGTTANDNTGDTLRAGASKWNSNFDELYTALGNGSTLQVSVTSAATGQVLRYNGSSFVATDFSQLTANLDTNNRLITSTGNNSVTIDPAGTGGLSIIHGGVTSSFGGTTGAIIDFPTKVKYRNEYASLAAAPPATGTGVAYRGYFYTVSGDDNPYVNINITSGGVGNVKAKVLTEYSSINLLKDVDTVTAAPTTGQVLKWSGSNWAPAADNAGVGSVNVFATVAADSGSTTANTPTDTLTITGGTSIATIISGDTLTINFDGTIISTFNSLNDVAITTPAQGDNLYWNGTDWVVSRSPMIWWDLSASLSNHYTFSGPGFSAPTEDPTIYVHRGFTYAFDNSTNGGAHPFRIQSTQGLNGVPYTTGQSGSGTNVLYWTVPMDSPATLYYQCTIHSLMNGTINVVQ